MRVTHFTLARPSELTELKLHINGSFMPDFATLLSKFEGEVIENGWP